MGYLLFASIFITVKSVQEQLKENAFTIGELFSNSIFFTLIVSLLSTYVLWFTASFLFFDPWHMFTCFIQYLLLTPTYINILNVYAFCNTHDITWGTKGDDKAEKLPDAKIKPGGKVDVSVPQDDGDLNDQYEAELKLFSTKEVKEKAPPNAQERQEDYYKGFRSAVVLFWVFTNFVLVAVVINTAGLETVTTSSDTQRSTVYLAVVLWSVAALSLFRFIGAMWFLVVRIVSEVSSTFWSLWAPFCCKSSLETFAAGWAASIGSKLAAARAYIVEKRLANSCVLVSWRVRGLQVSSCWIPFGAVYVAALIHGLSSLWLG